MRRLTRRGFLEGLLAAGAALVGALLEACGQPRGPAESPQPTSPSTATRSPARAATPSPTRSPTVQLSPTAIPSAMSTATLAPELAADTALLNGKVITVDPQDTIAQAVAIKDGLVQAVGSNADVRALIGATTQVMDLAGKALTPGLIDPHNHIQIWGFLESYYQPLMPPEITTLDDLTRRLTEVVSQTPEGEWVLGYFLSVGDGLPDRYDLDPISPNHPLWIMQQGGHYGSANSLALQIAGITADTRDPTGGIIGRDERGEPTGVFYNHRAMDLVRRHMPLPTAQMAWDSVRAGQSFFASGGVTTFHDNNIRGVENVNAYLDADREGDMQLRGHAYFTLEWPQDLDLALKEVEYYEGSGHMRFAGFKFLLDGQATMSYCHEPHNGKSWNTTSWEPQRFKEAVRQLHDTGLQVCVHCIGDAAVDLTLDAFEEAMHANPRPDPRHRIEHCILTKPESTQRIVDLGVVVSTQPQFIRIGGDRYPNIFGEERARRIMVTREWLDAGVHVALGSDSPTTPWLRPQVTLLSALTRITYSNHTYEPSQAITIQEALRAHTMGAAYAGHEEHIKGSVEPGKLADLVVWRADPYEVYDNIVSGPADWETYVDKLKPLQVGMTMIGGEVIYRA